MCSDYPRPFITMGKFLSQHEIGPMETTGSLFIYSDKIGYTNFPRARAIGSKGKFLDAANDQRKIFYVALHAVP